MCKKERILEGLDKGFIFPEDDDGEKDQRFFHPKLLLKANFSLVGPDGFEEIMHYEEESPPERNGKQEV